MSTFVLCTANAIQSGTLQVALEAAGFDPRHISVLTPDQRDECDFVWNRDPQSPESGYASVKTSVEATEVLERQVDRGSLAVGPALASQSGTGWGGITRTLVDMEVPEFIARQFENKVKSGRYLISIRTEDGGQMEFIKHLCTCAGAGDVTATHQHDTSLQNHRREIFEW